MRIELLGIVAMILGAVTLMAPMRWAFHVIVFSTLFGAAAALSLPSLGGASVLVPSLLLAFYCLRLFKAFGERPVLASVTGTSAGFWLLLLTVYAVLTAVFLPRLLAGETETMTVLRSPFGRSAINLVPLSFSTNNITQSVYALGGLFCFAFTFAYLRRGGASSDLVKAMFIVGALNLVFALLDVVTYYSGTAYLFDFIRTANYALLTGSEKAGFKRISGTFPEASAFAGYTIVLFAFIASLWLDRVRPLSTGILGGLLLLALLLSTSSTALVSLAVVLVFLFARSVPASTGPHPVSRPAFLMSVVVLVPLVFLLCVVMAPGLVQEIQSFLDEMLFSKLDSQSGRERFMWNAVAFQVFQDTWGLGAGLGSARASSYALVLLSNVGIVGAALFVLFIGSLLLQRGGKGAFETATVRAAKAGLVAGLCEAMVSGTVYDLGLLFYVLAGAIASFGRQPVFSGAGPTAKAEAAQ
ncbi:O-antigen ligase family protein [Nitratireductor soli]|uniref:O-antigen ligase family protein n=1 Tax=Nitratireductor soli TaxID=1670619 RepID=UPI00065E2B55|nr:O-antigen ligase family protein [Nitratireductor soli]